MIAKKTGVHGRCFQKEINQSLKRDDNKNRPSKFSILQWLVKPFNNQQKNKRAISVKPKRAIHSNSTKAKRKPVKVVEGKNEVSRLINAIPTVVNLAPSLLFTNTVVLVVRAIVQAREAVIGAIYSIQQTKKMAELARVHENGKILPIKEEFAQLVSTVKSYKNLWGSIMELLKTISELSTI